MHLKKFKNFAVLICCIFVFVLQGTQIANAYFQSSVMLGRSSGTTMADTEYARKINANPVYAKCTNMTLENSRSMNHCKAIVQGHNNMNASIGYPGKSPTYTFYNGTNYYMTNYVYEDGYDFARIHFRGDANYYFTVFYFDWNVN